MTKLLALPLLLAFALALAGCGDKEKAGTSPQPPAQSVPFDRAFIDAMIPHHRDAVAMAKEAKRAGLSQPELLKVANDIITLQNLEILDMQTWRKDWFGSPEVDPEGAQALGLSTEMMGRQHDPKDVAQADDVDQAFASMMIDHHKGAIEMAMLAREKSRHQPVRDLAEQIITTQKTEIRVLEPHAGGAMQHGS